MAATFIRTFHIGQLRRKSLFTFVPFRLQSSATQPQHDPAKPLRKVDPFCLADSSDNELSLVVQGLYSSNTPADSQGPVNSDLQQPNSRQVYTSWLQERIISRRQERIAREPGSELARSATFGSIRFDADNVPREGQELDDEEYNLAEEHSVDLLELDSPEPQFSVAKQTKGVTTSPSEQEKRQSHTNPMNPKIAAILQKNDVQPPQQEFALASSPLPKIYQIQCLNNLTRAEMWALLRDNVVFQNDFLLAVNKPYGLPIHTPTNECRHTILDFLDELTTYSKSNEQVIPLHRLDKDTTGVLLFAKTQVAATIIKEKFATRQIQKKYLAITKNFPSMTSGTIDIPIGEGKVAGTDSYRAVLKPDLRKFDIASSQRGAKPAVTHFQVIRTSDNCSFMEVRPVSGVKHQIRIHLGMGLGCPVLGDHKYSHREKLAPQRLSPTVLNCLKIKQSKVRYLPLHLHCSSIEFKMPAGFCKNDEPVFAHCRLPKHFMYSLRELKLK